MNVIGLDLSLVATGFINLIDGKLEKKILIKSKPSGPKPTDELKRLQGILANITDEVGITNEIGKFPFIDMVAIEGLAYMAKNTTSLVQLAALNYFVRERLYVFNIPFVIVAPTTLKKFVTGKGNSPKDVIMLEIYKRYGVSIMDNNLADAYGLARIAEALLNNKIKLNKPQQEVIKVLNPQL